MVIGLNAKASYTFKIRELSMDWRTPVPPIHAAINGATEEMRETTSKLREKSLSSSQRKELTAFQRRAQTKLKRAQDTMRKNLKVKKSKIDAVMSKEK